MNDKKYILWATLKILELRKALDYDNSFFTTSQLDRLFAIRDLQQEEDRKKLKNKVRKLRLKEEKE